MTAPATTPQEIAFHKYVAVLQQVSRMGFEGFAIVVDTASPAELAEMIAAAEILQRNLDRVKK